MSTRGLRSGGECWSSYLMYFNENAIPQVKLRLPVCVRALNDRLIESQ